MSAKMITMWRGLGTLAVAGALALGTVATGGEKSEKDDKVEKVEWKPAVKPKPLSAKVEKGLAWLARNQMKNGAWDQGEESRNMRSKRLDKASVADTCIATLAFLRAGHTPKKGKYASNVKKAVEFLCKEIEANKGKSLYITKTRGTRVQSKLGTYIDTFLACTLLSEVAGKMPDKKAGQKVAAVLDIVLTKIAKNQRKDGTWDNRGWAPVLAQGMAAKGINRAAQAGYRVDKAVLQRAENYAKKQYDQKSGKFKAKGSAGVALYTGSANLSAMRDSDNTNKLRERQARVVLANPKAAQPARVKAEKQIKDILSNRKQMEAAEQAIIKRMSDKRFVAGFGSNGGEEFLSHMNIGESLVVKGGKAWKAWDKKMTANMNRIQNKDGSWSGHHCITGRTFCTSSALLVLMVDRAPVPVAKDIRRR
jgi:hypothetical protein